jgi:hypothetical protein
VVAIASNSRSGKACAKDALRDDNEKQRGAGIIEVYFDSNVAVGAQSRSHVERVTSDQQKQDCAESRRTKLSHLSSLLAEQRQNGLDAFSRLGFSPDEGEDADG